MATITKDLGAVTAYAYAVAGGYTGTEEEFEELLGNIAIDLGEIENLSVVAETLPAGSSATASYADGVLTLGIPKGDTGDVTPTQMNSAISAAVAEETAARQQQDAVLSARMDTFTSLPSGSTSGDAELLDIRVAANGKVYPTAGDAVRGQINGIKNMFDDFTETCLKIYFDNTVSGTNMKQYLDYRLPAGQYRLTVENVDSTDTQYTTSRISFYGNHVLILTKDVNRITGIDSIITLSADVDEIDFYGAHSYGDGGGVVFSFNAVNIYQDTGINQRFEELTGQLNSINGLADYEMLIAFDEPVSGSTYIDIPVNIKPGTYDYKAGAFTSTDTDVDVCRLYLRSNGTDVMVWDNYRDSLNERTITLAVAIDTIRIYAGTTYANSAGDSFSVPYVRLLQHTNLSTRLDNIEADINSNEAKVDVFDDSRNVFANIYRLKKFYSHLGVDKTNNIIIPCQSLADVARTKRLGFDVLELNVRVTSDGKYVCLHGISGAFGYQFEDTNGNPVTNVMVNSMTLQDIKDNIRFKSIYPKYKTAPFTLQEMLYECKKWNVIPQVEWQNTYTDILDICDEIMGKNNYLIASYGYNRSSIGSNAPMFSWLNYNIASEIVNKCNASGGLYVAGLNVSNGAWQYNTDAQWKDYLDAIHSAGYLAGFVSGYASEEKTQQLLNIGFDVAGSQWRINEIETGNLCNLCSGTDFVSDFNTNGTVANGELTLNIGNTITPNASLNQIFLGGGSLHISFVGTIRVQMGDYIDLVISNTDGSDRWFSTFFEESTPTFTITAIQNTTVYDITYKASKT